MSCRNSPMTWCARHAGTALAGPIRCPSMGARPFPRSGGGIPKAPPKQGFLWRIHDHMRKVHLAQALGIAFGHELGSLRPRPLDRVKLVRELICGPGSGGSLQDQFNYSTAGPGGIGPLQLISGDRNRSLLVSTNPVRKCAVLDLDHEVSARDRICAKRGDAPLDDCLVLLRRTRNAVVGCKFRKVAARQ